MFCSLTTELKIISSQSLTVWISTQLHAIYHVLPLSFTDYRIVHLPHYHNPTPLREPPALPSYELPPYPHSPYSLRIISPTFLPTTYAVACV
jgi:hypothetical protein